MEVNVATTTSLWSGRHTSIPHCTSFSQTLTSSKRRRSVGSLSYHTKTTFLGTQLHRSKSCELHELSKTATNKPLRRVCSASFSSDEEFSVKMHELALQFKTAGKEEVVDNNNINNRSFGFGNVKMLAQSVPGLASLEAPWKEMVNHSSIEMKANSVDLPLSLRIIKRKLQEEALKEAKYCSINRAFSSMVFILEELHSFALRGVVVKHVRKDMHDSLLWIFQRVFSQTPTLMVDVMVMLADFTVYSVASDLGIVDNDVLMEQQRFGQMAFDKVSHLSTQRELVSGLGIREGEVSLWNSVVEEADQMDDSPVDREMRLGLVSPINARIELDDYANYTRTELLYKIGLAQEPNNPLLLANYAQFLYLVTQDYDRAEKCFKKAMELDEVDGETYSKYAIFQWKVRNDLWVAEENFLEAISADPTNSFHAANYANFLWQTGGEETCFPLESSDSPQEMV